MNLDGDMEVYEGKVTGPCIWCELGWKTRLETDMNQMESEKPTTHTTKSPCCGDFSRAQSVDSSPQHSHQAGTSSRHLGVCHLLGNR